MKNHTLCNDIVNPEKHEDQAGFGMELLLSGLVVYDGKQFYKIVHSFF